MNTNTLRVIKNTFSFTVEFIQLNKKNCINKQFISDLNAALDIFDKTTMKVLVFTGGDQFFCTGMDFTEALSLSESSDNEAESFLSGQYIALLKRINMTAAFVISCVKGSVMAGGIGILAVSDFVYADNTATFGLPEALWGLVPACLTPFLIQRIGYRHAYQMALTTITYDADKALSIGLIDDIVANFEDELRRLCLRANKLDGYSIQTIKSYYQSLFPIDPSFESMALETMQRVSKDLEVIENIRRYNEKGEFPWMKDAKGLKS